jgi:hypothetical protein
MSSKLGYRTLHASSHWTLFHSVNRLTQGATGKSLLSSSNVVTQRSIPTVQQSCRFSSDDESRFSPYNWWRNRQDAKEAEKYKQRVLQMVDLPKWTLGEMLKDLQEAVGSWASKVPGLNSSKEMKMAKQMHDSVSGLVEVVGEDADIERLEDMKRKEKLQAAIAGDTTVEQIDMLIAQFRTMTLMHRVVRQRKLEGKTIPTTATAMQAVVQSEGIKFMSKSEKKKMAMQQARRMMKEGR